MDSGFHRSNDGRDFLRVHQKWDGNVKVHEQDERIDRTFKKLIIKIISIDVSMFNEIYGAGVRQAGFHYPAKWCDEAVMDFSGDWIAIANPEYMFNFQYVF